MTAVRFGTDGWRGVIAEDFTFANVERMAQATADQWNATASAAVEPVVVVGYDRRFFSAEFAASTAEVMAGNGFKVILTACPTPTPAVSLAVRERSAVGGIMITASHNPARFNGFKLKADYGGSAGSELCQAVEGHWDHSPVRSTNLREAVDARRILLRDLTPPWLAAVKQHLDFPLIAKSRLRVAHEALFGVGAGCFGSLLARTTCRVTTFHGAADPLFGGINPEPVQANYTSTAAFLRRHPHDICLVTDGDADRIGAMDGHGGYLTTHAAICLVLHHCIVNRQGRGRVVKSITTTSMVDRICAAHGLPVTETGVGFKFIGPEMVKGGVLLGVEESGGIGYPAHLPERDGILAGMLLLEVLARESTSVGRLLARLEREFGPHRYARQDVRYPLDQREALMECCRRNPPTRLLRSPVEAVVTLDGVKFVARDGSWLMLRGSGTEPILRIYAEAASDAAAQRLLHLGLRLTRRR